MLSFTHKHTDHWALPPSGHFGSLGICRGCMATMCLGFSGRWFGSNLCQVMFINSRLSFSESALNSGVGHLPNVRQHCVDRVLHFRHFITGGVFFFNRFGTTACTMLPQNEQCRLSHAASNGRSVQYGSLVTPAPHGLQAMGSSPSGSKFGSAISLSSCKLSTKHVCTNT